MTFQTTWIHDPYIIVTEYSGRVTGGELDMNMLEYLGIVQNQQVYILLDFSTADTIPGKLFELSSANLVVNHPNTCWFAVVNPAGQPSRATRMLARDSIKVFNDRKSAESFLRAMVRVDTGVVLNV
jgi:hypothetical protein